MLKFYDVKSDKDNGERNAKLKMNKGAATIEIQWFLFVASHAYCTEQQKNECATQNWE